MATISTDTGAQKGIAPTQTAGTQTGVAPAQGSGTKKLTVFDMIIYGLIMMVPIAPFSIYAGVTNASGGMSAIAYAIAFFAMIFSVLSFGVMIRTFPSSGSIYSYTSKSFGPALGFIAGWLMLLQYLVSPDLVVIMASEELSHYVPAMPVWGWCLIFLGFVVFVATRGMQATMLVNRIALACEIIVLCMFAFFSIRYILANPTTAGFTTTALFNPQTFSISSVMSGVSLAVFSFVGFGCVATLTEEAKHPRKGPARAMLIMVIILAVLFVTTCYLATCVDPSGEICRQNPTNGFYQIAERVGGTWFGQRCAIAVALSQGIFTALVVLVSVSNILQVMGRTGSLPKALAHKNAKGVPIVAMLFTAVLSVALLLPFLIIGMDDLATVVNFGALTTYFLLNLCVFWYYWVKQKDHSNPLRLLICPLIGAVIIGAIFISLDTTAHIIGAAWIIVGIVYYLVATRVLKRDIKME